MRSYYDTLDVTPTATADEVTRAFRREIARYHPDKVEHLGPEFQTIAAGKTAELTQAYKTLTNAALRATYDAQLPSGAARPSPPAQHVHARPETAGRPVNEGALHEPDPASTHRSVFSRDRADAIDLVRKATVMRFREALDQEFGRRDETPVQGFDIVCTPPGGGFFSRGVPPRILGRCVAQVDVPAIKESWAMAARAKSDDRRDLCVFVMGPDLAPAGELGRVIADERRKPLPRGGSLVMVPVNTRTWSAHIPTDAPPEVKVLLARLQGG